MLIFHKTAEIAHALPTGSGIEKRDSFSLETLDAQELRFVAIGDAEANEIRKLALMIKVANE